MPYTEQDIQDILDGKKKLTAKYQYTAQDVRDILDGKASFGENGVYRAPATTDQMAVKLTYDEYMEERRKNSVPIPQNPSKTYQYKPPVSASPTSTTKEAPTLGALYTADDVKRIYEQTKDNVKPVYTPAEDLSMRVKPLIYKQPIPAYKPPTLGNPFMTAQKGAPTVPLQPKLPVYTPNEDSGLTPQQLLEKYSKVAQDKSLSTSERNRLAKQGYDSLGKVSRQQTTLPVLRPKINGTVSQEEIEQAMALQNQLAQQTRAGAGAIGFMNSASFGALKNSPFADKAPAINPDGTLDESKTYADQLKGLISRSEESQPVASGIGKFAGEAAKYGATANVMNTLPFMQTLNAGKLPARLAAGRAVDLIPDAITAAQETDNAADFAKNLTMNQITGLVFDGVLEGAGAAIKAIADKVKNKQLITTKQADELRTAIISEAKNGNIDPAKLTQTGDIRRPTLPHAQTIQQPVPPTLPRAAQSVMPTLPRAQALQKPTLPQAVQSPMLPRANKALNTNTVGAVQSSKKPGDLTFNLNPGEIERGFSKNIRTDNNMPDEIRRSFGEDPLLYEQISNPTTLKKASDILQKNGFDGSQSKLYEMISKNMPQPESVPLAKMLAKQARESGDVSGARRILSDMADKLTQAGQFT